MADSSISHYLKVPALSIKHVVSLVFQTAQAGDYYAIIHFRTSQADIIRMPVYFHVNTDVIRFSPTLIDFGLVTLNFD